jgi:hypothetical protein
MQNQLHEVQVSKKEAQDAASLGESMERLLKNRDFKRCIENGFFRDEPVRLAPLLAQPVTDQVKASINLRMASVGVVQQYIQTTLMNGSNAVQALADLDQAETEILAEGE